MARCPVCGRPLDWRDVVEQLIARVGKEEGKRILTDKESFMKALDGAVIRCPACGEEFYGRVLPRDEAEKVFVLLNDFKGSVNWDEMKVRLRLNSLLALDTMLEEWDRRQKSGSGKV
ncbi:MAG: hypothetical protein GXO14_03895 [Thermococci archaeon]|nr:hypothetical protein [Thermococci archaeon]